MGIKKIDKLILSSFWAPYLMSFLVAEFVLVLQFMWKYIDEILGKGFPFLTLIELVFYFAIQIIPQAIPLTILISSIMVFGNLSEKYELSSMKSAGISLFRIMRAAIVIAICTAAFSFISSNYLKPAANFKFYSLFYSMRKQKPSLSIEQGIFNKDFKNYVIRVGEKDNNGTDIRDVKIYDHTEIDRRLTNVITAENGQMYSDNKTGFIMDLYNGHQFKEMKSTPGKNKKNNYPLMRTKFEKFTKVFDLSEFEMDESSITTSRNKYDMMNQSQLGAAIDSINSQVFTKKNEFSYDYNKIIRFSDSLKVDKEEEFIEDDQEDEEEISFDNNQIKKLNKNARESTDSTSSEIGNKDDEILAKFKVAAKISKPLKTKVSNFNKRNSYVLKLKSMEDSTEINSFYDLILDKDKKEIVDNTIRESHAFKNRFSNTQVTISSLIRNRARYVLRKHQQVSWAIACLIFVFIGAPLGSIIRKGGYGYPLLVAIIFYVFFLISIIMGEKLIKRDDISPELAAWMPVLVLTPFAIILTTLALRDVKIDLISRIKSIFQKIES